MNYRSFGNTIKFNTRMRGIVYFRFLEWLKYSKFVNDIIKKGWKKKEKNNRMRVIESL